MLIDEWWIAMDLAGSICDTLKGRSWHLPEGTEENREKPQPG
jgi:hypothetical protein